jgi:hypothetical protein
MRHKFYPSSFKYPSQASLAVSFVLLLLCCFTANAQHRHDPWAHYGGGGGGGGSDDSGYGITLNVDYDTPTGVLGPSFKSAPAFNIGVVHYLGSFTFNATLGYHSYSPKQAIFSYDDGAGSTGTIAYQPYSVFAVYVGAVYNLPLTDGVKLYAGLNWGIYATHYQFDQEDQFFSNSADLTEEDLYFAPKLGFNFSINDSMTLGIEGKYNFFTPEGSTDTNPDVGTVYKSYAAGVVLTYKF